MHAPGRHEAVRPAMKPRCRFCDTELQHEGPFVGWTSRGGVLCPERISGYYPQDVIEIGDFWHEPEPLPDMTDLDAVDQWLRAAQ